MPTFQQDIATDNANVFADASGYGFGVAATLFQTAGAAAGIAITLVPIEQTYNIFDTKQNTNFRFPTGAGISPEQGDIIQLADGTRFVLLDVKLEEQMWSASGMREQTRQ